MRTELRAVAALASGLLFAPCALVAQHKVEKVNIGGQGGTDYLSVDPGSGHIFISRGTHVMIVDATGKVLGDIPDTPRVHGIAFSKNGFGFTTNGGDSTSTMFDAKTFAVKKKIPAGKDGLDGIMYDDATDKILTLDHSAGTGTAVVIDPTSGTVVATVPLSSTKPEGGVSNGKDRIFVNLEDKNAIDVIDSNTWKVIATWDIAPCDGPTGIAMDRTTNRIFSACGGTSVVVNAATGKVVAKIANGEGVDALGWDQSQKMMYIPAGQSGNVTIVHEDAPDTYSVVETVPTMRGAKTIAVDPSTHAAYLFTPEYGPAPAGAPAGGGRGPRGPITAAWFITVKK
jgi:DNA-binding beta-propeller fold protein YncE